MDRKELDLNKSKEIESEKFEKFFLWFKEHMPEKVFREIDHNSLIIIIHNLITLNIQGYFSTIWIKNTAICLCKEHDEADLQILEKFPDHGIRYYRTYKSDEPPPIKNMNTPLMVAFLHFTEGIEPEQDLLAEEKQENIRELIQKENPKVSIEAIDKFLSGLHSHFLLALSEKRLLLSAKLYFQAKENDNCQIEVTKIEDSKKRGSPSIKIVFAWKNTPKRNFLFQIIKASLRFNLKITRFTATYIDPFSSSSVLLMSIGLDGKEGKAAWEEADIGDFVQEISLLKTFDTKTLISKTFVDTGRLTNHQSSFFTTAKEFIHQVLTNVDPNQYSLEQIEKDLCYHSNLTLMVMEAFERKFCPKTLNLDSYEEIKNSFYLSVEKLDTGQPYHDNRKKHVLKTAMLLVEFGLKTNFYKVEKTAIAFRLDPNYLDKVPFDRKILFEEIPYGIFFVVGMNFIGYHIRFEDLARGGLRTVISKELEQLTIEKHQVFAECYNLSLTQQKKNKDIPEGGAKGIILLEPFELVKGDSQLLREDLRLNNVDENHIEEKVLAYKETMRREFLYHSQRSYVSSLLSLINCDDEGTLRSTKIIDYWKKPEYIYLGPDENMHNNMIEWIADYSVNMGYKPGRSFISSKPSVGINHKEYGVTSFGVNVYMHEVLLYLGINPNKDPFSVKISGGPDGDVAGNQMKNLHRFYKNTAKVVAITDVSGTIFDPEGLDLDLLVTLFEEAKSIRNYPPKHLHNGGFLLDLRSSKDSGKYAKQTLCYRMKEGSLIEEYLSGNEMNHLFRTNVHQTIADIFIPAGGRPKTLNSHNYQEFLDKNGLPTSKAIVEGANLYLTPKARNKLSELGVIILKDSSCNKGGVITSSMEVLSSLVISETVFLENKEIIVGEILEFIRNICEKEAKLLLSTYQKNGLSLIDISDQISYKINKYKYQILDYLEKIPLSNDFSDPLIQALFSHCPQFLSDNYPNEILQKIPDIHKKAIIAAHIASHIIYKKGIDWSPTIIEALPLILKEKDITEE